MYFEYYENNKETNLRLFKLKFAHIFNDIDDNLFKENQMLVNDIEINRDKIFEQDEFNKFVIKQACSDLLDTVRVILKFNEVLSLDLT